MCIPMWFPPLRMLTAQSYGQGLLYNIATTVGLEHVAVLHTSGVPEIAGCTLCTAAPGEDLPVCWRIPTSMLVGMFHGCGKVFLSGAGRHVSNRRALRSRAFFLLPHVTFLSLDLYWKDPKAIKEHGKMFSLASPVPPNWHPSIECYNRRG